MGSQFKPILAGVLFITLVMFGFNNCSGVNFKTSSSEGGLSILDPEIPKDPKDPKDPEDGMLKFSYDVPFEAKSVDVLFVIDNSQSMAVELSNLGNRFTHFSAALKDKDWQACFVTTDWENEKGQLRKWRGADYVLSPQTPGFGEIFKETLNHITEESSDIMSYYEHGIYSAYEAFGRAFSSDAKGCFRANAAKAIVIVSDEDELGDGWARSDGEQPQPGNRPENLIQRAKDVFGTQVQFSAHAVAVRPGDAQCLSQQRMENGEYEVTYGYEAIRYKELVDATKGVFISICESDYSSSLAKIGLKIIEALEEVELPCSKKASVGKVDIINKVHPTRSYSVSGKKVQFSPALVSGERVDIFYKCIE